MNHTPHACARHILTVHTPAQRSTFIYRHTVQRYFQLLSSTILIMEKSIRTLLNARLIIVLTALAVASAQNYCMWEVDGQCKQCSYNRYLHNGTCVEACPDNFVSKRPNHDKSWSREVGGVCNYRSNRLGAAWGTMPLPTIIQSSFGWM